MAEKIQALPKSLWRFYIKYAFRGNWGILIPWALLLIYLRLGMVIYPLTMKWLVAKYGPHRCYERWKYHRAGQPSRINTSAWRICAPVAYAIWWFYPGINFC